MTDPKSDRAPHREGGVMLTDEELRVRLNLAIFDEMASGNIGMGVEDITAAVLEALTAAGRIIPEGAEVEWGGEWDNDGSVSRFPYGEDQARRFGTKSYVKLFTRYVTPWREVQE